MGWFTTMKINLGSSAYYGSFTLTDINPFLIPMTYDTIKKILTKYSISLYFCTLFEFYNDHCVLETTCP